MVTPQYLNLHQDGSFINNKLFAGVYEANPHQGPFYEALDDDQTPYTEVVDLRDGVRRQVNFTVTRILLWNGCVNRSFPLMARFMRRSNSTATKRRV